VGMKDLVTNVVMSKLEREVFLIRTRDDALKIARR